MSSEPVPEIRFVLAATSQTHTTRLAPSAPQSRDATISSPESTSDSDATTGSSSTSIESAPKRLITHLLFDCDNTLVLSEEIAFETCAEMANIILAQHGVEQRYTGDMLVERFVGHKFCGILNQLMSTHNFTLTPNKFQEYCKREQSLVVSKLEASSKACLGAVPVLEALHKEWKYDLAVVSSSALRRIRAALESADLARFIPHETVFSAVSSLPSPKPKPDPAVYHFAMEKLGVKPEQCVAVEDSKSGAASACRAGIRTIAYVGCYKGERKQREIGLLLVKAGCFKVMYNWSEFPAILAEL